MSDVAEQPIGENGERDKVTGRFARGNQANVLVGVHSAAFWAAAEGARRDIAIAVIQDAGFAADDAPKALQVAADGLAQATLIRDAAFLRVLENGGPLSNSDRARRSFTVWESACATTERHLRLVGLKRAAKPTDTIRDWAKRAREAEEQS